MSANILDPLLFFFVFVEEVEQSSAEKISVVEVFLYLSALLQ